MAERRQHLVYAIIKFIEEQVQTGGLKEEDLESLEVASQCLETAFGLDQVAKDDLASKFPLPGTLSEIFQGGLKYLKGQAAPQISVADKEAADKLKAEGNEFMKAEQINEAVDCYTRALELDNTNAVYYCNRAAAFNKLSQFEAAIEDCNSALRLDPEYSKAFNRKGVAHMSLQQYNLAKAAFAQALDLDPQNESYKASLEQAEQKVLDTQRAGGGGAGGGLGGALGGMNLGGLNLPAMLENPALMNMASNLMSNPAMQQMMANVMMGAQNQQEGSQGLNSLLQAGQQLAQQVQSQNPELVEQLRSQMRSPEEGDGESKPPTDQSGGASGGSS